MTDTTISPMLLTLDNTATTLQVTRRTVERLIAAGKLRAVKLERRTMVEPSAIREYVDSLTDVTPTGSDA